MEQTEIMKKKKKKKDDYTALNPNESTKEGKRKSLVSL